jgi:hypothetical protein
MTEKKERKTNNITLRVTPEEEAFLRRGGRKIIDNFRADMRFIQQIESLLSGGLGHIPFGRIYQMAKGEIIEETEED